MIELYITLNFNAARLRRSGALSGPTEAMSGLRVQARLGPRSAILGPSGAGKTTLLEIVAGLRKAEGRVVASGKVLADDQLGIHLPPEKRRIGYVPQQGALFPHLSVARNLRFARVSRVRGGAGEAAEVGDLPKEEELIRLLELDSLLERYPRHLSGGETRRVALARALLSQPRLLILDEPTTGLDERSASRARAGIERVRQRLGVPLLLVTHRRDEALALADEILLLDKGRGVACGAARQVFLEAWRADPATSPFETPIRDNVVAAQVLGHRPEAGVTDFEVEEGVSLALPLRAELSAGAPVRLAIAAEALMVAVEPPRGLSARNAVEGQIDELLEADASVFVRVGEWFARLTPDAVRELELALGRRVWMVAKSHSWRIVAG